jgi:hypothetical protein
VPSLVLHWVK